MLSEATNICNLIIIKVEKYRIDDNYNLVELFGVLKFKTLNKIAYI